MAEENSLKIIFTGHAVGQHVPALAKTITEILAEKGMKADFDGSEGHLPFMKVAGPEDKLSDLESFVEELDRLLSARHVGYPEGRIHLHGEILQKKYNIITPDRPKEDPVIEILCNAFSKPFPH